MRYFVARGNIKKKTTEPRNNDPLINIFLSYKNYRELVFSHARKKNKSCNVQKLPAHSVFDGCASTEYWICNVADLKEKKVSRQNLERLKKDFHFYFESRRSKRGRTEKDFLCVSRDTIVLLMTSIMNRLQIHPEHLWNETVRSLKLEFQQFVSIRWWEIA